MQKQTLAIIGVALIAVAVGVAIFVSGNGSAQDTQSAVADNQPSAVAVPFTKIIQGTQSSIATRVNYVITSSNQLNELWKIIKATGAPPEVDFKTQSVIAVFAGKESTSSIAIANVEDTGARMVSIAITRPDSTCPAKKSVVSPYEVVIVPTTSLPLAHKDIVTSVSCPK